MQLASLTLGAPFEGTRIGYVEWGPGDAAHSVICVHGLTRNGRDFDALGEALASRGFRVIAVDVVGRGRSSWLADPRQYLVPVYAAQLKLVVEVLGLGAVDWVGTSMGGLIGMVLAAGQPQLIRRLVLNDIGPFVPMAALQQLRTYVGVNPQFANLDEAETYLRSIHAGFGPLSDFAMAPAHPRQRGRGGRRRRPRCIMIRRSAKPMPILPRQTSICGNCGTRSAVPSCCCAAVTARC